MDALCELLVVVKQTVYIFFVTKHEYFFTKQTTTVQSQKKRIHTVGFVVRFITRMLFIVLLPVCFAIFFSVVSMALKYKTTQTAHGLRKKHTFNDYDLSSVVSTQDAKAFENSKLDATRFMSRGALRQRRYTDDLPSPV